MLFRSQRQEFKRFEVERSLHCFQKFGFKEYEREEAVKKENGQFIDDIYLKLEL